MSVAEEDRDRAQVYGVLGALFMQAPSRALLDTLVPVEGDPSALLVQAWNDLAQAAREDECLWREEYEALFVGVGKPDVLLCGSYYLAGALHERPLAELRSDLARMGFERDPKATETEDHLAALCNAMHQLILRDDPMQQTLYVRHIAPWVPLLCDAIDVHPRVRCYRYVSALLRVFIDIESQAWSIEESRSMTL
ncbi:MAG TPA: molecular chaperone TorD family protein [Burkholderiaceae bacterium]|nr:molecular chaperone TorD family protein [Burkholderiaceae bacterium]